MEWVKVEGIFENWLLQGNDFEIYLEQRPPYCDRGNWVAKLFAYGKKALDIDDQDAWPRYYMDFERAKAEIGDWLKKRTWA